MTVERLCRDLGPGLIQAVVVPGAAGDRAIASVALCGTPQEIAAADRDGLVLAVGATGDADRVALVEAAGVALLSTDPGVAWGRLHELVAAAVRPAGAPAVLPAGVPASGDLFALADATAGATGAPVTIEDPAFQVLAFSREGQDVDEVRVATILGRRVPGRWAEELRRRAELDGVLARDEPAVIEVPGMAPRRVIAIRGGDTLLGSIWLAGATDAAADDALREAAAVAALQLLRRRAERELEHAARSAAVAELLRGGELSRRVTAETGLERADAFCVVALAVAGGDLAAHDQLAELLAVHLRAFRRRAAHGVLAGRGYVVVACAASDADRERVLRRCEDGLARASFGPGVRAGLGALASGPAAVPDARATADRALALGDPGARLTPFEDVRSAALLEDADAFVAGWRADRSVLLGRLLEHDAAHGTRFVETLRVVLELFGDTAAAARRLHVHANTVRYRLRQMNELTGVRLTDAPHRLALELELRALARDGER